MSVIHKINALKSKISLSSWLTIWYFITCFIVFTTNEFVFNNFVKLYYNEIEEIILPNNIQEILRFIDKKENKKNCFSDEAFLDINKDIFFLVEDLTNNKTLFYTPKMDKYIYSLRENNEDRDVTPDGNIIIREKNGHYFYYIKKDIIYNNRLLSIEILSDKSDRIELFEKYKRKSIVILFTTLFVCLLLSILISRIVLSPVNRIVEKIRSITSSNLHERIDIVPLPRELAIIKNSFNEVLERLENSFKKVSQFSDDIAHEIRTPVNNLKGEIEVALTKDRTKEEYIDILNSNLEECDRLSRIIDNLMFLARSEQKSVQLKYEKINVYKELCNMKDLYEGVAEDKFIEISIICDEKIEAFVDKIIFQRIINNLLSNAINYNKENGKIFIRVILTDEFLNIEVSDTGIGISKEDLPHVFDRLYRAERSRHTSSNNLGLGLSMVKSMVEIHKGTIEIKSTLEVGSSVFIRLPNKLSKR